VADVRLDMRTIKMIIRVIAGGVGLVGLYLIFGIVLDTYVFPAPPLNYANYFKPGDKLESVLRDSIRRFLM
jgi:hypothetical protein